MAILDPYPLSAVQEGILLQHLKAPRSGTYVHHVLARIEHAVDDRVLAAALRGVVGRHELLRTAYDWHGPAGTVHVPRDHVVCNVDVRSVPAADIDHETRAFIEADRSVGFDLTAAPLIRMTLFRSPEVNHAVLSIHHIIGDGASRDLLTRELWTGYDAIEAGGEPPVQPAPSFRTFIAWYLDHRDSPDARAYWRGSLGGRPRSSPVSLPRPAGGARLSRHGSETVPIDDALARRLEAAAAALDVSVNTMLHGAWALLLSRYTGTPHVMFGSTFSGRFIPLPDVSQIFGPVLNTLPIAADVRPGSTFAELAGEIRRQHLGLRPFVHTPLSLIAECAGHSAGEPLFDTCVVFSASSMDAALVGHSPRSQQRQFSRHGFSHYELVVHAHGRPQLHLELHFDATRFERAAIRQVAADLAHLLGAAAESPHAPLRDMPCASVEAWRARSRVRGAATAGISRQCLQDLVLAQAARTPDRAAVISAAGSITYQALVQRARAVAAALAARSLPAETPVGIYLDRDPDLVATMLGVLMAGLCYVPLEATHPDARLQFVLADSRAALVLTSRHRASRLSFWPAEKAILVEDAIDSPSSAAQALPRPEPEQIAYLIYTSGSTGTPKAVAIEHRNAVNFIRWATAAYSKEELARTLCATSMTFDMSVFELFAPLSVGGTVVLVADILAAATLDPSIGVTLIKTVPSALRALLRNGGIPTSVRTINCGGERLDPALVRDIRALPHVTRIVNTYGPTETTTSSTWHEVSARDLEVVPIGKPIDHTEAFVLGPDGVPAPPGVAGELYLAGAGVARGYLHRPGLTAERFSAVDVPCIGVTRAFKTGDRARIREDGEIEFLGRLDNQVKVRGFRVELEELETALAACPGVAACGAVAVDDSDGEPFLAAFVVANDPSISSASCQEALRRSLPEYIVPSRFCFVAELARNANGKIDRAALARQWLLHENERRHGSSPPEQSATATTNAHRGTTEELLAAVWSDVLRTNAIDRDSNFFSVGGHSLLAIRLASRLRAIFGVELTVAEIFSAPTFAAMAQRIDEARGAATVTGPPLVRTPRGRPLPLSFGQQRLWFLHELERGSPAYHVPLALQLAGPLDVEALTWALDEVARRHESLRTTFPWDGDDPVQAIAETVPVSLSIVDLRGEAAGDRPRALERHLAADASAPFDLANGPLWRARLVRLRDREHVLALTFHHIIIDGWSLDVLVRELGALYTARRAGTPLVLPDLPVQYVDYAVWQRQWLTGAVLEQQLEYWRTRLRNAPPLIDLPLDRERSAVETHRGAVEPIALDANVGAALRGLAEGAGATLQMALLAGFQMLLARYTGQRDVLVGVPVTGRTRLELEGLVGFFVNTLVLRSDVAGSRTYRQLIHDTRMACLAAYAHQDVPFEMLVDALAPVRSRSHAPLVQVLFSFREDKRQPFSGAADLTVHEIPVPLADAKFDLTLALCREGEALTGQLAYRTDLFDASTIQRFGRHLRQLLAAAVAEPDRPLSALEVLGAEERHTVLVDWNRTGCAHDELARIDDLVRAQAARSPETVAVDDGIAPVRYGELVRRATGWGRQLRQLGVAPEEPVGVCMGRSADLVAALLAVLNADGAYVPLDPAYPIERLRAMLADSGARWVLTDEPRRARAEALGARPLICDTAAQLADDGGPVPPARGRLAYILYTSGSTGQPKGVAIEHRSTVTLLRWAREVYPVDVLAGVLASTSICFDLSVFEIFAPLTTGGTVILASALTALPSHPARDRVTLVNSVPTAVAELERAGWLPRSVRVVNLCGEPLGGDLARRLYARGVEQVWNLYGPTETTTYATGQVVEREVGRWAAIGRPLLATTAYVLDAAMRPVPPGVVGELYLGGAGVARGYHRRPAVTARAFVPDPFTDAAGARLYRTGDFVRHLPDGRLHFLGRRDTQVKVRGYRIELDEVGFALQAQPEVRQAVAIATDRGGDGGCALAAYVVLESGADLSPTELRRRIAQSLPGYMVPAVIVILDAIPLTPNGKVDRRALPPPDFAGDAPGDVAPSTAVQAEIAAILADALEVDRVGVHDDFFALGGDSIVAIRVVSRVRRQLGFELPMDVLFDRPTVAGIAEYIADGREVETRARGTDPDGAADAGSLQLEPGANA